MMSDWSRVAFEDNNSSGKYMSGMWAGLVKSEFKLLQALD